MLIGMMSQHCWKFGSLRVGGMCNNKCFKDTCLCLWGPVVCPQVVRECVEVGRRALACRTLSVRARAKGLLAYG